VSGSFEQWLGEANQFARQAALGREFEKRNNIASVLITSFISAGESDIATGVAADLTAGEVVALFQCVLAALVGDDAHVSDMVWASGDIGLMAKMSPLLADVEGDACGQ
jgi:hypothetical protein